MSTRIDQWKGIESSNIDPHKCDQQISDKRSRKHNGAGVISSTNGAETTGHEHGKE